MKEDSGGGDDKGECGHLTLRPHSKSDMDTLPIDLKHYPHFDAHIPVNRIEELVNDPERVARHPFYPFLRYDLEWQPFRSTDAGKPNRKSRPIRYAARGDAYIFTHYRRMLSALYEERLHELGIQHCPIAYRRIPKSDSRGNRSNIDFAKDAFDHIDELGDCVAIALDIHSYFENLDHTRIKQIWRDLLREDELPPDHYAVFRNITKYRFVEQREVYRRLGFFGNVTREGRTREGFITPLSELPKQLCRPADFRARICGDDPEFSSLVKKHDKSFGIPQGAPISDLIANFYLLEFDLAVHTFVCERGGRYMRYSDDILLLLPGGREVAERATAFVTDEVRQHGSQLEIKESKSCEIQFMREGEHLNCKQILRQSGQPARNGLEYLGFRYDGRKVYVRESTMSRFYRKVSSAARRAAFAHVQSRKTEDVTQLKTSFDYSLFSTKFLKVKRGDLDRDPRTWTFYSYLRRAATTFGPKGDRILKQTRNFKTLVTARVEESIERAVLRR